MGPGRTTRCSWPRRFLIMMQQRGLGFDHSSRAQQWMGQAGNIASAFDRKQFHQEAPGKTAGGALMSGGSMAIAGAQAGSIIPGLGTAAGAIGGAVIGLGGYLLS